VLIESFRNGSLKKSAIELRDLILSGNLTKLNPRESSAVKLLRHQSERLVDRAQAVSLASQLKKSSCTEQQAGAAWHEVSEFTITHDDTVGAVGFFVLGMDDEQPRYR
jgi:hypothetical protein